MQIRIGRTKSKTYDSITTISWSDRVDCFESSCDVQTRRRHYGLSMFTVSVTLADRYCVGQTTSTYNYVSEPFLSFPAEFNLFILNLLLPIIVPITTLTE